MPSVTKWLHIERLCGRYSLSRRVPASLPWQLLGLENGPIVPPLQVSCAAKMGAPQKAPFQSLNRKVTLGREEPGAQWSPSPDTEEMEMSYWGAALVLIIAMSGRGDERREGRG